jgi:hypothetical protein
MRRPFSILIVALFTLAPLSALLPGGSDAQLPACCRRNGKHHCAMMAAMAAPPSGTTWFAAPDRCPLYGAGHLFPAPIFALPHSPATPSLIASLLSPAPSSPAILYRFSTPSSRGPPSAC